VSRCREQGDEASFSIKDGNPLPTECFSDFQRLKKVGPHSIT
jgi:hypothetical protein